MRLVDDLMEPYRPFMDHTVSILVENGHTEVNSDSKKQLLTTLYRDVCSDAGCSPLTLEIQKLAISVVHVLTGQKTDLSLPATKW
jgi:CRISPR-associated protein Cas1